MAIETRPADVIDPCVTCGHEPNRPKRMHYLAACLESHEVYEEFSVWALFDYIVHYWADEGVYSAVRRERPFTDDEVLEWLERCHSGETVRHTRDIAHTVKFEDWPIPERTD